MKFKIPAIVALAVLAGCAKESKVTGKLPSETMPQTVSLDSVKSVANQTKMLLVSNLTKKISDSGTVAAMEFCSTEAIPLTKSAEEKFGLEIKRVSERNRNPDNTASAEEMQIIEQYKKQLLENKELEGKVHGDYFYSPLVTNRMCLQCHGDVRKDLKPEVAHKLTKLYPDDKATGYKENELRGLLRVKMR